MKYTFLLISIIGIKYTFSINFFNRHKIMMAIILFAYMDFVCSQTSKIFSKCQ